MKLASIDKTPDFGSLFQISPDAREISHTSFEDLARIPEKLETSLNAARIENDIFAAAHSRNRRATRSAASQNKINSFWKNSEHSLIELKQVEFSIDAPAASSVQLAADFTDWEKYPLDMIQSENGVWFTLVPLAPGNYSYRFIVDGQWCDDPHSNLRVQNPFGTNNAIRQVA